MWEILFRYISREIISSVGDPVPIYFKGDYSSVGRKYPLCLYFLSHMVQTILKSIIVLFFVQFGPVLCTIWSCSLYDLVLFCPAYNKHFSERLDT